MSRIRVSGATSGRERKESSSVGRKTRAPGGHAFAVALDVLAVAGLEVAVLATTEAGFVVEGVVGFPFVSETYQAAT